MRFDYSDILYSVLFPILFGMLGVFFLIIGLRVLLTKRPFLVSNSWLLSTLFALFVLMIFYTLLILGGDFRSWAYLVLGVAWLVIMWYQLKGYVAYAVTDASFREALLAALQRLQLPYEESLSVIRLTSVDADLQISVQSWMGNGYHQGQTACAAFRAHRGRQGNERLFPNVVCIYEYDYFGFYGRSRGSYGYSRTRQVLFQKHLLTNC